MQENILAARVRHRTPLGELTALPRPSSWWTGVWLSSPQQLHRALGPLALPLTRNRRLSPRNLMGWMRPTHATITRIQS